MQILEFSFCAESYSIRYVRESYKILVCGTVILNLEFGACFISMTILMSFAAIICLNLSYFSIWKQRRTNVYFTRNYVIVEDDIAQKKIFFKRFKEYLYSYRYKFTYGAAGKT